MNFANVLANISNIIIPVIIFYVVAEGLAAKKNVYEDFVKGATDGFHTVIQTIGDITTDRDRLSMLVDQCNLLELSPLHLNDVIEDYLAN